MQQELSCCTTHWTTIMTTVATENKTDRRHCAIHHRLPRTCHWHLFCARLLVEDLFLVTLTAWHPSISPVRPPLWSRMKTCQKLLDCVTFCAVIHEPQERNPNDFGGPLTFYLSPPACWHFTSGSIGRIGMKCGIDICVPHRMNHNLILMWHHYQFKISLVPYFDLMQFPA